jgi:hypothetical protein
MIISTGAASDFSPVQLVTIFASAFLGTTSAFLLERYRRRHQLRDREKAIAAARSDRHFESLLGAQGVLLAQANSLAAFLAQFPTGANPFDNLKHIFVGFSKQSIDLSGLAFLGSSHNPQLIVDLDVADASYRMAVDTAALRNTLLDDFFNHKETEVVTFDEETGAVRAKGNPIIMRNLRQANQISFDAMKRAQELNTETSNKLAIFAKKVFPKEQKFPFIPPAKLKPDAVSPSATVTTVDG